MSQEQGYGYGGYMGYGVPTNPQQMRALMAAQLMREGTSYSPILSPWQGAARMSNALISALLMRQMGQGYSNAFGAGGPVQRMLGLGAGPGAAPVAQAPNPGYAASVAPPPAPAAPAPSAGAPYPASPIVDPAGAFAPSNSAGSPPPAVAPPGGRMVASADPSFMPALASAADEGAGSAASGGAPGAGLNGWSGNALAGAYGPPVDISGYPMGGNVPASAIMAPPPDEGAPAAPAMQPSAGAGNIAQYIAARAQALGIDPNVALRVAAHEGLNAFNPNAPDRGGDGGSSFGPFQLHYGGINPKMANPGLGDEFTAATGLSAQDPSTWRQQVDFALQKAAQGGWSPWMGAKAAGVGPWQGIGHPGSPTAVASALPAGASMQPGMMFAGPGAVASPDPLSLAYSGAAPGAGGPAQAAIAASAGPGAGLPAPALGGALGPMTGIARGNPVLLGQPQMAQGGLPFFGTGNGSGFNEGQQAAPQNAPVGPGASAPQGQGGIDPRVGAAMQILADPYAPPQAQEIAGMVLQAYGLPHPGTWKQRPGTNDEIGLDWLGRPNGMTIQGGPITKDLAPGNVLLQGTPEGNFQGATPIGGTGGTDFFAQKAAAEEQGKRMAQSVGATAPAAEEMEFYGKAAANEAYKELQTSVPNYIAMTKLAPNNDRGSAKAFIDAFGRTINPGASMRLGMFQVIKDSQSLPDQIVADIQAAYNGSSELSADAKQAMLNAARSKVQSYKDVWDPESAQYAAIAKAHGYNVDNVVPKLPPLPDFDPSQINSVAAPQNAGPQPTGAVHPSVQFGAGPPGPAAAYLRQHPDLAPAFDQKYGAGAAAKVLGQ